VGGVGSGRVGAFHAYTDNYVKITVKGLTKGFTFLGIRIRRPVSYPDAHVDTSWRRFWLEWVECTKGGHRPYFKCPGGCGRNVFTLYAPPRSLTSGGRGDWRCRHCHKLRYKTQWEKPLFQDITRVKRAALVFGLNGTPVHPDHVERPSGMHRRTFERLLRRYREAYDRYEESVRAYLGKQRRYLDEQRR
jgi:hypothetical protein